MNAKSSFGVYYKDNKPRNQTAITAHNTGQASYSNRFGTSQFILMIWLKINSDNFCFRKRENIAYRVKGRKLSKKSIYPEDFATMSFESKP